MSAGITIALSLGAICSAIAAYWVAYKYGRVSILKEQAQATVGAKNEEIKATLNRPSKSELVNSLRKDKF